jgi:hypothetical protein
MRCSDQAMDCTAEDLYFYSRLRQRLLFSAKLPDVLWAAPTGPPIVASNLGEKKNCFSPPPPSFPSKGGPTKIFTLNRKTISCRVTWTLSETANLYSRQIMILQKKTKHTQHGRGPLLERRTLVICTGFTPLFHLL